MQVWAVIYEPEKFTEDIYQGGLLLVDHTSHTRIKRFYRREDACRCLIGRLLPRMVLHERAIARLAMSFESTEAGKPYITTAGLSPPIAYNISHDNALVAMAFGPGKHEPPAFRLGVDIMKVEHPKRESFPEFVKIFSDQLTALESRIVLSVPQDEGVRRFFWIWTMKEAYTKALGIGLGFDFRRIQYDVPSNTVTVDGQIPKGWQLIKFTLDHNEDLYQGVLAEFVGGDDTLVTSRDSSWPVRLDAASFVSNAMERLR